MRLYQVSPLTNRNTVTRKVHFDLISGAGNILIVVSNKIFDYGVEVLETFQYNNLQFAVSIPPILTPNEIAYFMQYVEEYCEWNACGTLNDLIVCAVPSNQVTKDITGLINSNYFRFFILQDVQPSIALVLDNYEPKTILERQ